MGDHYGRFLGYTGFFPILREPGQPSRVNPLRAALAALPFGEGSMFARAGLVHGARLFVIDALPDNGRPARTEHLEQPWLVFSATLDGDLGALAARLATVARQECETLFSHCHGFAGAGSAEALLGYFTACRHETTFLYVDVDDFDLEETLRALVAQGWIADLVERCQGLSPAERKREVAALAERIRTMPTPEPGGYFKRAGGAPPQ